ncbi:MAG: NHL repeat-containing protein, partial [Planctomycetes bacterium]|nr:NHL repeat-containing protein [Planctomycetota bacterium]
VFGMGPGLEPPTRVNRPTDRQPAPHYGTHWDLGAGYLAIPEPETHAIRIYDLRLCQPDAEGRPGNPTLVTEVGGFGIGLGRYRSPQGLFIGGDPLTLLVCDKDNGRLVETRLGLSQKEPLGFTLTAARVRRALNIGQIRKGPGAWQHPWVPRPVDVERAGDGTTFVLCELAREVIVLDRDWRAIGRFAAPPDRPWVHPVALGWNEAQGRLYVADEGAGLVHVLDREGQSLASIGTDRLRRPTAVAFDSAQRVLVMDRERCVLSIFDSQGNWVEDRGGPGLGREEFFGPTDVDVDGRDNLFVLDHGNHRGMVFDGKGAWFQAFGSRLYTKPARFPAGGEETE